MPLGHMRSQKGTRHRHQHAILSMLHRCEISFNAMSTYLLKSLLLASVLTFYAGCTTQDRLYEGMYEGLKRSNKMNDLDADRAKDIDQRQYSDENSYRQYKEAIEATKF